MACLNMYGNGKKVTSYSMHFALKNKCPVTPILLISKGFPLLYLHIHPSTLNDRKFGASIITLNRACSVYE